MGCNSLGEPWQWRRRPAGGRRPVLAGLRPISAPPARPVRRGQSRVGIHQRGRDGQRCGSAPAASPRPGRRPAPPPRWPCPGSRHQHCSREGWPEVARMLPGLSPQPAQAYDGAGTHQDRRQPAACNDRHPSSPDRQSSTSFTVWRGPRAWTSGSAPSTSGGCRPRWM